MTITGRRSPRLLAILLVGAACVIPAHDAPCQSRKKTPEPVIYELVFRRHVFYSEQAARIEEAGDDAASFRADLREADGLTAEQSSLLDRVASECLGIAARLDRQARQAIEARPQPSDAARTGAPPAPDELAALQSERDAAFSRGRARLRAAFGDRAFRRFESFVQGEIRIEHHDAGRGLEAYSHSDIVLDHENGAAYAGVWAVAGYSVQRRYELDLTSWIETEDGRTRSWSYALGYAPLEARLTAEMEADAEYSIVGELEAAERPAGIGTGAIEGRVTYPDGRPAAGARVTLERGGALRTELTAARTNEAGMFRFDKLKPGTYRVRARKQGDRCPGSELPGSRPMVALISPEVEVAGGRTSSASFELVPRLSEANERLIVNTLEGAAEYEAASVVGCVEDADGNPVPEATVSAMPDGPISGRIPTALTDEDGVFAFAQLAPKTYTLYAAKEKAGYAAALFAFHAGEAKSNPRVVVGEGAPRKSAIVIKLGQKSARLVGRVVDAETGAPVVAQLQFERAGQPRTTLQTSTDLGGLFDQLVPATPIEIRASAPGYEAWSYARSGSVERSPGGEQDELRLAPGEKRELTIALKPTARP